MKTIKHWLYFRLVHIDALWTKGDDYFETSSGACGPWVPRWQWVSDVLDWAEEDAER